MSPVGISGHHVPAALMSAFGGPADTRICVPKSAFDQSRHHSPLPEFPIKPIRCL